MKTYLAQLFYINFQPEVVIIYAESGRIARAAARKVAAGRGGALDKAWPGTNGHGIGLVRNYQPTKAELKKWPAVKATLKPEASHA